MTVLTLIMLLIVWGLVMACVEIGLHLPDWLALIITIIGAILIGQAVLG